MLRKESWADERHYPRLEGVEFRACAARPGRAVSGLDFANLVPAVPKDGRRARRAVPSRATKRCAWGAPACAVRGHECGGLWSAGKGASGARSSAPGHVTAPAATLACRKRFSSRSAANTPTASEWVGKHFELAQARLGGAALPRGEPREALDQHIRRQVGSARPPNEASPARQPPARLLFPASPALGCAGPVGQIRIDAGCAITSVSPKSAPLNSSGARMTAATA